MPPRRGGKSLVTSRTRLIAVRLAAATRQPAARQAATSTSSEVGAEHCRARRWRRRRWPGAAGGQVQRAQRRRSVGVGDEPGEPPGAVVGQRALRPGGVQVGVGRQRRAGWRRCRRAAASAGRPTKSATPSVSQRGASSGGVGAGRVVKKLVAQHDSQRRVAHRGGAGREHDAARAGASPSAAMSAPPPPPARANCSSVPVATTTMSRGQSAPQNASTASTASSMFAATRASSGRCAGPPRLDQPHGAAVAQRLRLRRRRRGCGAAWPAAGRTGVRVRAASDRPRPAAARRSARRAAARPQRGGRVSSGGRCRSGALFIGTTRTGMP